MLKKLTLLTIGATLFGGSAMAAGHVAEGEALFAKRCKSCHMIQNGDETIVKGGKTGPNLWQVVGRQAGSADFKYGKSLKAAGDAGLVWDEAELIAYLADPKKYLRTKLDDKKAKSKMSFRLKKEDQRAAIAAYLASQVVETQ